MWALGIGQKVCEGLGRQWKAGCWGSCDRREQDPQQTAFPILLFRWCASAVPFGAVCAHPHEQRPCTTTPDPESPTKFGVSPVYRLKSANTSAEAAATCASPHPAPVPPAPDATASPSLRLWPPAPRAACEGLERRKKSQGRQCDTVFLDFSCSQAAKSESRARSACASTPRRSASLGSVMKEGTDARTEHADPSRSLRVARATR